MVLVEFFQLHSIVGLWILGIMTLLWILSLILRDSSIVDIFWGAGFVVSAWVAFLNTLDTFWVRDLLIVILVTIWGLRLSTHILIRNWGKGEDFRYVKMREEAHGQWWWKSFLQVFLLQGLLMWLVASPLTAIQLPSASDSLAFLDYLGIGIWLVGFYFESVGDYQLARFKANPENKGKVLDKGVWRATRHPNYFGDAAQWWGFYLIALASGGAWWTVFSPILMTYLLVKVSGAVLLEKTLKTTKPGYQQYVEKTSAFFPWFPKK